MDDFIKRHKERIQNLKKLDVKEANTRSNLIDPLLIYLDWDIHNINEVEMEKQVISGYSVDYALKINGVSKIFIEAKKVNDNLSNLKDISKAVRYANDDGIEWCLITNGDKLNLYKALEPGDLNNKLVLEINISNDKNLEFLEFFKKERIRKDIFSTELNEIISINKIIKTLESVFFNLNDDFIEYIEGKITTLTKSQIKEALKNIDIEFINTVLPKEITVSDEIIEDKEIKQISEDVIEIQLPAARSSDIPAWRKYGYLPFPMRYRSFFPGYKIPFTFQTDIGDLTTWITGGYVQDIEGDPKVGTYISKNVTKFFRAHPELAVGDILRITKLQDNSYRMEIIKSK